MQVLGACSMEPGEMDWFEALPLAEQIRVLREWTRDPMARENYRCVWERHRASAPRRATAVSAGDKP
jgi:hypothetical protein